MDHLEGALLSFRDDLPRNVSNGPARTLRAALLSGAALACLAVLAMPIDAYGAKASSSAKKSNPEKDGFGAAAKNSVLQIVVSIGTQRVTLFSNGQPVAHGSVATGLPGHSTPMGVFSIIQKDRYHHSNIYNNAPMYYMQRITWSGVAMHQGVVPGGRPASHGCIRLTHGFAAALWPTTKLGVRVIVARNDLAPVDFEHPALFTPRPRPADSTLEVAESKQTQLLQVAESARTSKDAGALDVTAQPTGESAKPGGAEVDPPKPPVMSPKVPSPPAKYTGQVAVFVSRKEGKVFVRQGFAPLFDMPVQIDQADQPLGTHVFTALGAKADGGGMRWNLITVPTQQHGTVEKRRARGKSKEPVQAAAVQPKPPATAAQALDRIHLPQEAVDRINEVVIPGSSLIVSDQGISGETGRGTEFIVLTR